MPEKEKTLIPSKEEGEDIKEEISDVKTEEYDEDKVIVSKGDLEKMKRDKENYRKGMLAAKEKRKSDKEVAEKDIKEKEQKFLTKEEYSKSVEKTAIDEACKDELVNDNWKDIMSYYSPRRGKSTAKDIKADIDDAVYLWKRDNPDKVKKDDKDKKATADLSTEDQKPKGGGKEGEKPKKKGRKILKPQLSPTQWYD